MTASELGDFLRSRRGLLSPEDAGLHSHGIRRVPGLRREEVAILVGVSADYYTRLETRPTVKSDVATVNAETDPQIRDVTGSCVRSSHVAAVDISSQQN